MLPTDFSVSFTVPLTRLAHEKAQQYYLQHSHPIKAKEVYLNTLAIYAVNYYLNCFGIETNFDSKTNAVKQALSKSNTLNVNEKGKLECLPILPNQQMCSIPADAWTDRIGYIAVQLNQELTEAVLLGFIDKVETEQIPLTQFNPVENLLDYLSEKQPVIDLNQWFHHIFVNGWQRLEDILITTEQKLYFPEKSFAFSFRSRSYSENIIERAKLITLSTQNKKEAKLKDVGINLGLKSVILLIAIASEKGEKIGINIQLHPNPEEQFLPPNIKLELLSATDELLKGVSARVSDNWIQLPYLKCISGESFRIRVTLEDVSLVESFSV